MIVLKIVLLAFLLLFLTPIGVSAAAYWISGTGTGWRVADRSSAGLLPPPDAHSPAVVRVFAAQTVRWRGIFATHCWIVFKPEGTGTYTRYDYTAWGAPIRLNGFEPDGRWFGHRPETVFAADGAEAERLIPLMRRAIENYAWRNQGDYRAWPGPNSNTFVAAVLDALPGLDVTLPPTAIGKDYPYDGKWVRPTQSGTGWRLSLGGYLGFTIGWIEGIEISLLGGVVGLDIRRPALKLPGIGRIGMRGQDGPATPLPPPVAEAAGE
ncbi:DUF3750 domain-containing protein [Pseudoroseomonas globiformis]|uniref:DUF3750 domain-containing protein n=1 Tax=Teichococcus globiformis TaxID=2307229 RepID=A0ABV7G0Y4_9PROT